MNRLQAKLRLIQVNGAQSTVNFAIDTELNGILLPFLALPLTLEQLWLMYTLPGVHVLSFTDSLITVTHKDDSLVLRIPQSLAKKLFTVAPRVGTSSELEISYQCLALIFGELENQGRSVLNSDNEAYLLSEKSGCFYTLSPLNEHFIEYPDSENEFVERQELLANADEPELGGVTPMKNRRIPLDG